MEELVRPRLVIVTGVSGAGKTTLLYTLEELGFYVVENTPVSLMDVLFFEFENHPEKYTNVAFSISLQVAKEAYEIAKKHQGLAVLLMALDCATPTLIERFKLTRKVHPLQHKGLTLIEAIQDDAEKMMELKGVVNYYLDTTKITGSELRKYIYDTFIGFEKRRLNVVFVSFGYKKIIPQDLDMIIDTRMLPNPYWVQGLKDKTGLEKPIREYVMDAEITDEFISHVTAYLDFYLERLNAEHRALITIGIGCSGGQHRSVVIAEYLKKHYAKKYQTLAVHRDIPR